MNPGTSLLMHLKLQEQMQQHLKTHIHFTVHGPKHIEDTAMITYVLIHGEWGSSHQWDLFQNEIHALREVRTIAVDLRGYGKSNHMSKQDSLEHFAHDVHKIVKEVAQHEDQTVEQIEASYILVGWSLGGVIASILAAKHPRYYSRLVLVAPFSICGQPFMKVDTEGELTNHPCETREEVLNLPFNQGALKSIQEQDLSFFTKLAHEKWFNIGPKPEEQKVDQFLHQSLLQTNLDDILWMIHTYNITELVKQSVTKRVLIYHGKLDIIVPIKHSYELQDLIGKDRCQLVAAENVGHMPLLSVPKELAQEILRFSDQI